MPVLIAVLFGMTGCVHRIWNVPLTSPPAPDAYDFHNRLPRNDEELFVVLAFSGGGTRAAAFSYGVLEKLRDTPITIDGRQRRLLDEVDVITSVSGGSYTAAYYGLFGDRTFEEFEPRFLYLNFQRRLLRGFAHPVGLAALAGPNYNRGDLSAAALDRSLFGHKTFADMSRGALPFVIINASDLNNAATFSFVQQQFDFLCSDLSAYPVANAVMASSAVPGIFAPIALRNFAGCPQRAASWIDDALAHDDRIQRRYAVARALERYSHPERMPVVRLVDGGITDNLGVRGSMMSPVAHYGNVEAMAGAFTNEQLFRVRNVLVIIANAQTYAEYDWSLEAQDPSLVATVMASFDSASGILNNETVALARDGFLMWQDRINALRGPDQPRVKVHFAVLTFNQIADTEERRVFNSMPTTLGLERAQVDALRELAGRLLEQSPEFRQFRTSLSRDGQR